MIRYLITLTFFIISTQAHAIAMSGEQIICGPSVIFEGSISEIDPIPCRASDLPDGSVAKNCGFNLTITTNEIYSRKTPEPAGTQLALIQKIMLSLSKHIIQTASISDGL